MAYDEKSMRERFAELTQMVDEIRQQSAPLRAQYDQISAESRAAMDQLAEQFKKIEAPLYDLVQEQGRIARALNGKTGMTDG